MDSEACGPRLERKSYRRCVTYVRMAPGIRVWHGSCTYRVDSSPLAARERAVACRTL
jgi:hypothetical protein